MKIIRIISDKQQLTEPELRLREEFFVPTVEVAPAWLSAFTSMKVRKALDREKGEIIEVTTVDNILTAISARKISDNPEAKIVVNLPPNSPTPLSLPKELCQNADLWIFPSEEMKSEFEVFGTLKKSVLLPPAYFGKIEKVTAGPEADIHLAAFLTAKPDTERIIKIIDAVDALPNPVILHFLGQSEAKYIMPAVQHVHNLAHPARIVWEGENFDLAAQLTRAQAILKTSRDITEIECAGASLGTPAIDIDHLTYAIENPQTSYIECFAKEHNPRFHVEQFSNLIRNI